jgi:hypothetical protein
MEVCHTFVTGSYPVRRSTLKEEDDEGSLGRQHGSGKRKAGRKAQV